MEELNNNAVAQEQLTGGVAQEQEVLEEQQPQEEAAAEDAQPQEEEVILETPKVFIALTKNKGKKKVLVTSMDGYGTGYTADGICVEKDGIRRIFSLKEYKATYGIDSDDKAEGELAHGLGGYNGEQATQVLISIFPMKDGDAPVEAQKYGWLPDAGEMDMIGDNIDAFNAACEAVGDTPVTNGKYWTSVRSDNDHPWFYDAEGRGFGSWLGGRNLLLVRPCMSAEDYEAIG